MAERQDTNQGSSNRGFASMDEERSFAKDRELASEADRKGGEASGGGNRGSDSG